MGFSIEKNSKGNQLFLNLHGKLDEMAGVELVSMQDEKTKSVVFDFGDVSSINSSGIRVWCTFLRTFGEDKQISFVNCSPAVVTQMLMISSFSANAQIDSVNLFYQCPACSTEKLQLLSLKDLDSALHTPPIKCPRCSESMDLEEDYESVASLLQRKN